MSISAAYLLCDMWPEGRSDLLYGRKVESTERWPECARSLIAVFLLQGYAVKAGMLVGRGELLLFMDADGATRVSDLEKLEAALASLCSGQYA